MIDEGLRKAVETLSSEELYRANIIHLQFADMHHGYAVIKEEIEECEEALTTIKTHLDYIWNNVRTDDFQGFRFEARVVKIHAIELALEAIQVAAMAEKFLDMPESENKKIRNKIKAR